MTTQNAISCVARRMWVFALSAAMGAAPMASAGSVAAGRVDSMTFRTVALTGTAVPGTEPGVDFSGFYQASINATGHVVFSALLEGDSVTVANETGIWSEGMAGLRLVARADENPPGTQDGVFFSIVGWPVINSSSRVAFAAFLTGPNVDALSEHGLWAETGSGLLKVARTGDPAPGTVPSVDYSNLASVTSVLNSAGTTAFGAQLTQGSGVWLGTPGTLETVILSGDLLPGTGGLPLAILTSQLMPSLNNNGQTVFSALSFGGGAVSGGIWVGDPSEVAAVATTLDQAPGTSSVFVDFGFGANPSLNDAGQVVFQATISSGDLGIWSGAPTALSLVARTGELAPGIGAGVVFGGFPSHPVVAPLLINGHGETAFLATVSGPGVDSSNDHGVWVQSDGNLRLVARTGDAAPGTEAGVRFLEVGGTTADLGHTFNSSGQLALRATLVGSGVNTSNDEGLWAEVDGVLRLIVREGQTIEVAPDDLRTVAGFLSGIVGSGNEDGRASAFNDLGQIVFAVYFSDFSGGVFVVDTVGANGPFGDADGDSDVDLDDLASFAECLSGAAIPANGDCVPLFDSDADGDVDLLDFDLFQRNFSGPPAP